MIWALIILRVSYPELPTTTKSYDFLIGIIHNLKMQLKDITDCCQSCDVQSAELCFPLDIIVEVT